LKIIITGQNGFIGSHLYNNLSYRFNDVELVEFEKSLFNNQEKLDNLIRTSDIIIHLAGINRHKDQDFLFNQNILLSNHIISSIERTNFKGKVIFASSIQESVDNAYGKSKKKSRELFMLAANQNNFSFDGLIIPNVFGPFCKPNYNSFIATFCNNIVNGEKIFIKEDKEIQLIYIDNLITEIMNCINTDKGLKKTIKEDLTISVSEVKDIIESFYELYYKKGIVPKLDSNFKLNLFHTFVSYIKFDSFYPKQYKLVSDPRGSFAEVMRSNILGQYSYSVTLPGEIRGNHFHTRKFERFSVISGSGVIEIRKIDSEKKYIYKLNGKTPSYVDMPIWYTHNIKNTGDIPLITLFWINEFYDEADSDTFFEKV
tara:strand:+ start:501 stop:1613 length:1113 start_codon:yes stop_codon:yes gene_type:complete